MEAFITDLQYLRYVIRNPLWWLFTLFQIWMLIDAIRRREWIWALFILTPVGPFWYYFQIYTAGLSPTSGFELPGSHDRRRIKQLQAQIHHLDKAHHHSQLGDIYFQQGKLEKAEASYRNALERDAEDIDTRAHLGQCLLRQKRPDEARPLLEGVVAENPKHDYNHTLMALAETLTALGEEEAAIAAWRKVIENNSYPRAKVQLAELYLARNQVEPARVELRDVLADEAHAPAFQRRRDRVWFRRARRLMHNIS